MIKTLEKLTRKPINSTSHALFLPLHEPGLSRDLFISWDTNFHLCSVSGATWGSLGRTFDGTDDKITIPPAASINTLPTFTIMFWANQSVVTNEPVPFRKGSRYFQMGTGGLSAMRVPAATTGASSFASNLAITLSTWYFYATRYDDTGDRKIDILIDGVECTYSPAQTAAVGALSSDASSNLLIGQYSDPYTVKGTIDLFRIVPLFLSDSAIQDYFYSESHIFGV